MDVEREKIGGVRGKRGQRTGPGEMTVPGDPVGGTKARLVNLSPTEPGL